MAPARRLYCGLLATLYVPDHGRILFDGELLERGRIDLRRRLHFLPDLPVAFFESSVIRHIAMAVRLYDALRPGLEDRVVELLRDFDLLPLAEVPLSRLSRGERYKGGALVAMLAFDPELWLLDEPFASGMDPRGLTAFRRHAREATARGRTVICSTQIMEVAERFSDRSCILHRGRVHAFGRVEASANEPVTTATRSKKFWPNLPRKLNSAIGAVQCRRNTSREWLQ